MENKSIIIILVAVVIVLAAILGFMFLQSANAKEPTKLKITSDKTQYEGGELAVQLTDLNKNPISKEIINITITNSKGKIVVEDFVKTNSKGKAKLDLDLKKGKYNVNVTYEGNNNLTGNSSTQKLIIKEAVTKVESSVKTSSDNGNYLEGPETDSLGITKEQAMRAEQISGLDVKYDSESGMYVQYDPINGIYHN